MACQMEFYNADLHPDSMVKTTALNGAMGHCGAGTCCPFGYHCDAGRNGDPQCVQDSNQNAVPFTTTPAKPSTTAGSSTSSATTTTARTTTPSSSIQVIPTSPPTTTSVPGQNNGASSGADATPTETAQATSDGTPTAVIAGASVGAVLLVLAVAFIAFIFFKRRHKHQAEEAEALKLTRSTSSFGNIISNPIIAENTTMRSDFVRKSPGRSSVGSGFGSDRASTLVNDAPGPAPATPSPARMRDGVGTARIPPIRNMAQARQSSIAYGVGAPDTSPYNSGNYHAAGAGADDDGDDRGPRLLPYPETPRRGQEREPSSISINVFADPRIATPQRNDNAGLAVPGTPPDMRRASRMTTFSDMLRSADLGGVARGEPYVPGSQQGTPASRRR